MPNTKANITIFVIIILLISSLSGLLVSKYVKNIINFTGEIHKYYKAYYLAYGGLELELTKIKNHGFGFEDTILSGSTTNSKNFSTCGQSPCYFEAHIHSLGHVLTEKEMSYQLTGCNDKNIFNIKNGEGIIIPLFTDSNASEGTVSGMNYDNYTNIYDNNFRNITLKIFDSKNKELIIGTSKVNNLDDTKPIEYNISNDSDSISLGDSRFNGFYDFNKKNFLYLVNPDSSVSTIKICINSSIEKLPTNYIHIETIGKFQNRYVSIEAIKQNKLPDYLIYNIIKGG